MKEIFDNMSRRQLLKLGLMTGGATLIGGSTGLREAFANSCFDSTVPNPCGGAIEVFPTSPLIGGKVTGKKLEVSRKPGDFDAFTDPLPIPKALRPVDPSIWSPVPNPVTGGTQDSDGVLHEVGWDDPIVSGYPLKSPMYHKIDYRWGTHDFTSLKALPIDAKGNLVLAPGQTALGPKALPPSTIWGFNGTFPGPRINAEYGQPLLVRFDNHLDENPLNLDGQDFGAPDRAFLTHLHNAHTAPESDGNPHHKPCPYGPGQWVDNLYLNWPAGGDDREKQSFFWFHDHRMDHTGANVYKGMVGIYPIYDPVLDSGDETKGLRLPGVRDNHSDGSFDVEYDIPLVFYDCRLDDGVTQHQDFHNGCGQTHPEWWGKTFFRHFPNHGFVGDVFTVNGAAYPMLEVKRRRYRFRFLDASISRQYELKLMQGTVAAVPGQQGQYNFVDRRGKNTLGQQVMKFRQIASEGGLLPFPIDRDSFQIWPAKRREVIIDFTKYMDGTPTTKGDVIYLTNVLQMLDGRQRTVKLDKGFDPNYCVPVLKFVIGNDVPDNSEMPALTKKLRDLPPLPANLTSLPTRTFVLDRKTLTGEIEWVINNEPFDPHLTLAFPKKDSAELWTITNAGGGWTHPLHIHMEEHQVISRNGVPPPDSLHPDDISKEDVVALEGGESVTFYRKFRTFTGNYVCHCHNLAHEDHAMMFGWEIVP